MFIILMGRRLNVMWWIAVLAAPSNPLGKLFPGSVEPEPEFWWSICRFLKAFSGNGNVQAVLREPQP